MQTVLLVLTGFAAGILGGMGMGGGTLLIPLLTIFFSVSQHSAQGINLLAFIPMSVIALVIHFKNKLISFKEAVIMIIPAFFTAAAGSLIAVNTDAAVLKKLFGAFLITLSAFQIFMMLKANKK